MPLQLYDDLMFILNRQTVDKLLLRGSNKQEAVEQRGHVAHSILLIMSFSCSLYRQSLASLHSCGTTSTTPVGD